MSRCFLTPDLLHQREPHLGHAYNDHLTDAVARAHRLMGDYVIF